MKPTLFFCLVMLSTLCARPDTIECVNGDRYNGNVLLVTEKNVKFESEITGVTTLARDKVVSIHFAPKGAAPLAQSQSPTSTNIVLEAIPLPGSSTNLDSKAVEQVQNEFLAGATPEAQAMFKDMAHGIMSGTLNIKDIRSQAQGALSQLKDLQKDLDDDDNTPILGSYISILENFLKQSATAAVPPPAKTE